MDVQEYKIEHKALYEVIADKLELIILNDTTQISQKLPSEQYLAESFGVSRPVIREALKILKERGLIASKQGSSTVITDYSSDHFVKTMNRIAHMKNATPEQIYQIRNHLEILSARLAAANATHQDVARMKQINEKIHENLYDAAKRAKWDVELHNVIARASKNPLLAFMMESLADLLQPIFEKIIEKELEQQKGSHGQDDGLMIHDKIVSAIEARNEEDAADLMRTHLMISVRNFEFFHEENRE